jgi:hypothetical protein
MPGCLYASLCLSVSLSLFVNTDHHSFPTPGRVLYQGMFYLTGFITYGVSLWYASRLVRESNAEHPECLEDPLLSQCFSGGTAIMAFFSVQMGMEQVCDSCRVVEFSCCFLRSKPMPPRGLRCEYSSCLHRHSCVQVGLVFPVWSTITTAASAAKRLYHIIDAKPDIDVNSKDGIVLDPQQVCLMFTLREALIAVQLLLQLLLLLILLLRRFVVVCCRCRCSCHLFSLITCLHCCRFFSLL